MPSSSDKEAKLRAAMHQADAAANPPKPPRMHPLGALAKTYATREIALQKLEAACAKILPPDTFVPYCVLSQPTGGYTPAVMLLHTNTVANAYLVGLAHHGILVVG